ncbi:putative reverse transcriptase domain-containing protein [Tanacetum coccineum]
MYWKSSTKENVPSDFWSDNKIEECHKGGLYEYVENCILNIEDDILSHLKRESTVALDLIRFIKQQIDEEDELRGLRYDVGMCVMVVDKILHGFGMSFGLDVDYREKRENLFRIELTPGATPVAKSPYRLAPSEMEELSGKLMKLQDKDWKLLKELEKSPRTLTEKCKVFDWGEEQELAFQTLKDKLCNAPVLALPDGPKDFVVYCDASGIGLCCVLIQRGKVIAYASRQLKIHKKNYTTHELDRVRSIRITGSSEEAVEEFADYRKVKGLGASKGGVLWEESVCSQQLCGQRIGEGQVDRHELCNETTESSRRLRIDIMLRGDRPES